MGGDAYPTPDTDSKGRKTYPTVQSPPRSRASSDARRLAPLPFEGENLDRSRLRALLLDEVRLFHAQA